MLFWTHILIGLFVGLLCLPYFGNGWLSLAVLLFASIFPDIDSPRSKIGKKGFSKVLMAFTKHRGVVHSILFMTFIYLILFNFWRVVSFPFLIGYSIHLILDCFTIRGVRLFYPLKYRFRFLIKSGGAFECFLMILFFILDCVLIAGMILK